MTIHLNFTFKEYLKLSYLLAFKRTTFKIFITFLLINTVCSILQLNGKDVGYPDAAFILYLMLVCLIAVVFAIYRVAQKRYYPNFGPGKPISYEFTPEEVRIQATGYSAQLSWEQVQKVEQLKSWILIYPKGSQSNAIHKRSFSDEQLDEFYSIVMQKKHIKLI